MDESNLRHSLNEQDRVARDDTYQKIEWLEMIHTKRRKLTEDYKAGCKDLQTVQKMGR